MSLKQNLVDQLIMASRDSASVHFEDDTHEGRTRGRGQHISEPHVFYLNGCRWIGCQWHVGGRMDVWIGKLDNFVKLLIKNQLHDES